MSRRGATDDTRAVRRCATGDWCRTRVRGLAGPVDGAAFCLSCRTVHGRDVRALPLDYLDLEQLLARVSTVREKVSGSKDPPGPYAIGVDALQHDIWHAVTTFEEIVCDVARLASPSSRVRRGFAVQRAVTTLTAHFDTLASLDVVDWWPVGPDGAPETMTGADAILCLVAIHRRARAVLGLTKWVDRLYGECPECAMSALRRDAGSETVYCAWCGGTRTWDDYRQWLAMAEAHARLTK